MGAVVMGADLVAAVGAAVVGAAVVGRCCGSGCCRGSSRGGRCWNCIVRGAAVVGVDVLADALWNYL